MHYHLVALTILSTQAPPERMDELSTLGPGLEHHNSSAVESWALDICGSAFTSNTPSVTVNAFGPIAYCK